MVLMVEFISGWSMLVWPVLDVDDVSSELPLIGYRWSMLVAGDNLDGRVLQCHEARTVLLYVTRESAVEKRPVTVAQPYVWPGYASALLTTCATCLAGRFIMPGFPSGPYPSASRGFFVGEAVMNPSHNSELRQL